MSDAIGEGVFCRRQGLGRVGVLCPERILALAVLVFGLATNEAPAGSPGAYLPRLGPTPLRFLAPLTTAPVPLPVLPLGENKTNFVAEPAPSPTAPEPMPKASALAAEPPAATEATPDTQPSTPPEPPKQALPVPLDPAVRTNGVGYISPEMFMRFFAEPGGVTVQPPTNPGLPFSPAFPPPPSSSAKYYSNPKP